MVATFAIIVGIRTVELNASASETFGNVTIYEFPREEGIFVVAQDLCDCTLPYARRITDLEGHEIELSRVIRSTHRTGYRFELGEQFCVIELVDDVFWISKVYTKTVEEKCLLHRRYLASQRPISSVYDGTFNRKLSNFVPAIKAGAELMQWSPTADEPQQ